MTSPASSASPAWRWKPVDCRRLPGRQLDPPHRDSADAWAVNSGAAIAPLNPSRKPPAPTTETKASGEIDASVSRSARSVLSVGARSRVAVMLVGSRCRRPLRAPCRQRQSRLPRAAHCLAWCRSAPPRSRQRRAAQPFTGRAGPRGAGRSRLDRAVSLTAPREPR